MSPGTTVTADWCAGFARRQAFDSIRVFAGLRHGAARRCGFCGGCYNRPPSAERERPHSHSRGQGARERERGGGPRGPQEGARRGLKAGWAAQGKRVGASSCRPRASAPTAAVPMTPTRRSGVGRRDLRVGVHALRTRRRASSWVAATCKFSRELKKESGAAAGHASDPNRRRLTCPRATRGELRRGEVRRQPYRVHTVASSSAWARRLRSRDLGGLVRGSRVSNSAAASAAISAAASAAALRGASSRSESL